MRVGTFLPSPTNEWMMSNLWSYTSLKPTSESCVWPRVSAANSEVFPACGIPMMPQLRWAQITNVRRNMVPLKEKNGRDVSPNPLWGFLSKMHRSGSTAIKRHEESTPHHTRNAIYVYFSSMAALVKQTQMHGM